METYTEWGVLWADDEHDDYGIGDRGRERAELAIVGNASGKGRLIRRTHSISDWTYEPPS